MRFLAPLALFALASLGGATTTRAQDGGTGTCPMPTTYEPDEFYPAASAGNVATDVAVRVRYTPGSAAVITDPPSTLVTLEVASTHAPVAGSASWLGDTVVFRPFARFSPTTRYSGTAIGPDATVSFSFTTGTGPDSGPPTFSRSVGIASIASTATMPMPCDAPDGAYRIDVTVNQAVDDSAPGDIEYLLYVWRAANLHAPRLVARIRNFASSSMTIPMSFVLPVDQSTARVCVAVLAVDDVGNVASSEQKCVDPIQGNYFEPLCSVAAPRAACTSAPPALAVLATVAALVVARRRRRR